MDIEKTIEKIKRQITIGECEKNIGIPVYISDLKAVLNTMYKAIEESAYYKDLVKLERKEKEQLKKSLKRQIKKKDLIINKMAKFIAGLDIDELICKDIENCTGDYEYETCEECIKEYFTKKVEGK